jgi:hypothetical protein
MRDHLEVLRPVLILAGVASGVVLASKGFAFPSGESVQTLVAAIDGAVSFVVWPLEQVVDAAAAWLQGQGAPVVVADHWKHAFVLLWLVYVAVWGLWAPPETLAGASAQWLVSGGMALVAGVLFATVPLDSREIFFWPGIGTSLIITVRLWTGGFRMWVLYDWLFPVLLFLVLVATVAPDLTLQGSPRLPSIWPGDREFFAAFPNEAFARFWMGVALTGVLFVLYGVGDVHAEGDTLVQRWANSRITRFGFNVAVVTLAAAGIVAMGRLWA